MTITTPAYIFDFDAFRARCAQAKKALGDIPLTYSMKANPFLLDAIDANAFARSIDHIEVCSPGELRICRRKGLAPERIIYSGVNKEAWDVEEAVEYGVGILTAESRRHAELENRAVLKLRKNEEETRRVILRLTSGNQFGMSEEDILDILQNREQYPALEFYGIHYYSGTQKKIRQIRKDLQRIEALLEKLEASCGFRPQLIEYGPGTAAEYFKEPCEEADRAHFEEVCTEAKAFAEKYPLGIEMGRYLASDCGHYLTRVMDLKENSDTNYVICDGGIHHLRYYGQTMAMQVPPLNKVEDDPADPASWKGSEPAGDLIPYMLCGSLCTTADILVREVMLPPLAIGDLLIFHRCGAYSVSEGISLFLSRALPEIWSRSEADGLKLLRARIETADLNMGNEV